MLTSWQVCVLEQFRGQGCSLATKILSVIRLGQCIGALAKLSGDWQMNGTVAYTYVDRQHAFCAPAAVAQVAAHHAHDPNTTLLPTHIPHELCVSIESA